MLKFILFIIMFLSAPLHASRNYYAYHFAELHQKSTLPEVCESRAFPQSESDFCKPLDFALEVLNMELPGLLRRAALDGLTKLLVKQTEDIIIFVKNDSNDFLVFSSNRLYKISNQKDQPPIVALPASIEDLQSLEAQVLSGASDP